jgi:N-carbamoyl-L-amino-acid hydrolase
VSAPGNLRIDLARLLARIERLGEVGAIEGGGVCRLALTAEDCAGRDLVVGWMRDLGLAVTIDRIGNVVGVRPGTEDGAPVMIGSHIDTVRTGGRYDGNLGVLAGLEVVRTLADAGVETKRPLAVAFFTNEEGARFAPDMMGSMVHQGHLDLNEMLAVEGIDGARVGQSLSAIGYAGEAAVGGCRAHAFVELHVEQGPVLEREGITIGAVEGVQGISWTELTFTGVSNHAGTTPMTLRHDAGLAAAEVAVFARALAREMGGDQVATVGAITLTPNLVNVIANRATLTVDLRNTDEALLCEAEERMRERVDVIAQGEGLGVERRALARFEPVAFDRTVIDLVEREARALGHTVRRLPSGAGHDAQAFAPNCPTGMIFVPSVGGVSHNVREHTEPGDIEAGANVLLRTVMELAG